ncbi:MAG: thiamine-phosphate kinase [Bacillota bacterium]
MPFAGGEFGLIGRIKQIVGAAGPGVELGIGDDAAVLQPPQGRMLVTMDMLVEGVHFDLSFINPFQLGAKALAVNISDIAAMGGRPRYVLVSLGATDLTSDKEVEELYQGMVQMAHSSGASLVGGDTVRSPGGVVIDVVVIGEADYPVTRGGARPGQLVGVTGQLGASAAGLGWLKAKKAGPVPGGLPSGYEAEVVAAHLAPAPRVAAGQALAASGAVSAMIDISDGLASEVNHIAAQSAVGIEIELGRLPVGEATQAVARLLGVDLLGWVLEGGEDYELLFAFSADRLEAVRGALAACNTPFHIIGRVLPKEKGVTLIDPSGNRRPLEPRGYSHFSG